LGIALFMRVPSPAASTMDRQLLLLMENVRELRVDRLAPTLYHARNLDQIHPSDGISRLSASRSGRTRLAILVMVVTPLFFSSNLIFGRGVIDDVAPFTLALVRWTTVALVLAPFIVWEWQTVPRLLAESTLRLLLLAFLGMWVCSAIVYLALGMTSATNGTLIYTTSPVIIIVLEALFFGRRIGWREAAGALIAFAGVATILLRGDPAALVALDFNLGDLLFVGAAISWAAYSILYRSGPCAPSPT